jgi:hypothetical protein
LCRNFGTPAHLQPAHADSDKVHALNGRYTDALDAADVAFISTS